MVVAIGHQHHRATGGACRLRVIAGVAQHQRARGRCSQRFAGLDQGQRVGLFALEAVTAKHACKKTIQAFGLEQWLGERQRLVGQASQRQARPLQGLQPLHHAGVHGRMAAVDFQVVVLVAGPGLRKQCFNFDSCLRLFHGR